MLNKLLPFSFLLLATGMATTGCGGGTHGIDGGDVIVTMDAVDSMIHDGSLPRDASDIVSRDNPLAQDVPIPPPVDMGRPQPPHDACGDWVDCTGCVQQAACGWCSDTNTCSTGTPSGSSMMSCSGFNWAYFSADCHDFAGRCSRYNSCDSCSASAGCGWCSASNSCKAGTGDGASDGSCGGGNWHWTRSSCAAPDHCSTLTDCLSCDGAIGCGWCLNRNQCFAGTTPGPSNNECAGASWAWMQGACF